MKKLILLTSIPLTLAACGNSTDMDIDLNKAKRNSFSSRAACLKAYEKQIKLGMTNPCTKNSGGSYYGPYMYYTSAGTSSSTRYFGYTDDGRVKTNGLHFNGDKYAGVVGAPLARGGTATVNTSSTRSVSSSSTPRSAYSAPTSRGGFSSGVSASS